MTWTWTLTWTWTWKWLTWTWTSKDWDQRVRVLTAYCHFLTTLLKQNKKHETLKEAKSLKYMKDPCHPAFQIRITGELVRRACWEIRTSDSPGTQSTKINQNLIQKMQTDKRMRQACRIYSHVDSQLGLA